MPTNAELAKQVADLSTGMAAILAAMQGGAAPTADVTPTADATPKGKAKGADPVRVDIPLHDVTIGDVSYRLGMVFQSSPAGDRDPVIYRSPRTLIESKGPGDSSYRKVGTITVGTLMAVRSLSKGAAESFLTDPRSGESIL